MEDSLLLPETITTTPRIGHKRQRSRDDQDLLLLRRTQQPADVPAFAAASSIRRGGQDNPQSPLCDNDGNDRREAQFQSLANHRLRRQAPARLARQSQSSVLDYLSKSPLLKPYYDSHPTSNKAQLSQHKRYSHPHKAGQHVLLLREDHVSLDQLNPHPHSTARQSSTLVAVVNLVATVCGGGVLSLPLAFAKAGIVPTSLLMVYGCVVTDFSLVCLVDGARKTGARNYSDLCAAAYGSVTQMLNSAALGTMLCGSLIAYQVLVKDIWTPVVFVLLRRIQTSTGHAPQQGEGGGVSFGFSMSNYANNTNATVNENNDTTMRSTTISTTTTSFSDTATPEEADMLLACILLAAMPLMLKKDLHALRHTCYVGFSSCVLLMLAVIFRASQKVVQWNANDRNNNLSHQQPQIKWYSDNPADILFAFPIVILCYFCSYNVLAVHSQLVHPSRPRIRWVLLVSMWTCFVLFMGVGLFGYLYTADLGSTPDNILTVFDLDDTAILAGRMGFCLTLLFGLPLVLLPCREALMGLPRQFRAWKKDQELIAQYQKLNDTYAQQHAPSEEQSQSPLSTATNKTTHESTAAVDMKSPHLIINGVDFDGFTPTLISKDPERRHGTSIVYGSVDLGTTTTTTHSEENEYISSSPGSSVLLQQVADDTVSRTTAMTSDFALEEEEEGEDKGGISPPRPSSIDTTLEVLPGLPPLTNTKDASMAMNDSWDWVDWWENSIVAHCMVTVVILLLAYIVAVSVPGVAVVWSIVGSSMAVWIAFVVPTACFLKIRQHKGLTMQALYAWLLLAASCVAMVVCTRQAVLNAVNPH